MLTGRTRPEGEHMKRSIRPALGVVILALALPTAALANHHDTSRGTRKASHAFPVAPALVPAATVTSFTAGVLTLAPAGGGPSIAAAVTDQTRFLCVRTGGRGRGFTPPPPCDSSQLVSGAGVLSAGVRITQTAVQFSDIVLLPAVQGPVTS
jgi:hypothetical protein